MSNRKQLAPRFGIARITFLFATFFAIFADTRSVCQAAPDIGPWNPEQLIPIGNMCFFVAEDDVHGRELWRSDGTATGTMMLRDITPGRPSTLIDNLTSVDNILFFRVLSDNNEELWKSDGTPEGTGKVANFPSEPYLSEFTAVNGRLLFRNGMDLENCELWRSDGTTSGTIMIRRFTPGSWRYSHCFERVGSDLCFHFDTGKTEQMWKYDGTTEETTLMPESPHERIKTSGSTRLAAVKGLLQSTVRTLFLVANDESGKARLWINDGTTSGSRVIRAAPGKWYTACADGAIAEPKANRIASLSQCDIDGDGRLETVQIYLSEGRRFRDKVLSSEMGEKWRGHFTIRVTRDNAVLSTQSLDQLWWGPGKEGGLSFLTPTFPLVFRDYNGDGKIDFNLGRYACSNGWVYKLFTIHPNGTIEPLPVAGKRDGILVSTSENSTARIHAEGKGFRYTYYDNSPHHTDSFTEWFTWNGKEFVHVKEELWDGKSEQ